MKQTLEFSIVTTKKNKYKSGIEYVESLGYKFSQIQSISTSNVEPRFTDIHEYLNTPVIIDYKIVVKEL